MVGFLWDFAAIVSIMAWIVTLAAQGHVSIPFATFALAALVIMMAVGRAAGGGIRRAVRLAFRSIPVFPFLTLAAVLGGGDFQQMVRILAGATVLLVMLGGLYLMIFGAFSSRRRR
ncbi:MAG: hypothetical protein HY673_17420 [Chloroflexi bacterium]|nr:hypothetical protein [Chloroflexota bacterium]